ncbi:MAG: hypothetical protein H6822_16955 [Planctomycetaceae bacterium]|nr:hypothetical protein [Planctomycetales bacterium]MCB9923874.1 hypothetical protein [Planctomycetaceae bacterium]
MSLEHLRTILWLRWRISSNQWRGSGTLNAVLTTLFVVCAIVASVVLFFAALISGTVVLRAKEFSPDVLMLTWDAVLAVFLLVWGIGLMTELQRSELLSLDRLLHLPLSLSGVFFLNYASSLLSLPIIVFVPGMLGLALAFILALGPQMIVILPLLISFLLMVTALTYQLRGWLATLMENKRRRKSILVAITMLFILAVQTPQFVNIAFMRSRSEGQKQHAQKYQEEVRELMRQLQAGEIDVAENERRLKEIDGRHKSGRAQTNSALYRGFVDTALLTNKFVPFGWLPYGVRAAAMGSIWPGMLASIVMFGVGGLSLWRCYASTMRFYTGTRAGPKRAATKARADNDEPAQLSNSLETKIPLVTEPVSAVALASFRSILRAPESKMALLTPLIMVGLFGGVTILGPGRELRRPELTMVPPFIAIGIIGVMLFGLAQLMSNIFGMDRGAFRAFVLLPVTRRDVLLGKNLAIVPVAGCITVLLFGVLQLFLEMRVTHLLATLVQLVPAYLLVCLLGNTSSILAPMPVANGTLKPASPNFKLFLVQMFVMMAFPIALLPATSALGIELLFAFVTDVNGVPIYLLISLVEAVLVVWFYLVVLEWQGRWLQQREPRILEILARVPE